MKVLPDLANVRSRIAFGRCTSVVRPEFVAPDVAVLDRMWPRYSICEPSPVAQDSHRRMCQCGHNAIVQSGDLELLCHSSSETLGESGYTGIITEALLDSDDRVSPIRPLRSLSHMGYLE